MIAYIFYVHNTMTLFQIEMAIKSIDKSKDISGDLWLHNSSDEFSESEILEKLDIVKGRFNQIRWINNKDSSVAGDISNQINVIDGYDQYFCHKADFYLSPFSFTNSINKLQSSAVDPMYINFCKFDLRENFNYDIIGKISNLAFDKILDKKWACDMTDSMPEDFGIHYEAMGYRGVDGVMHSYNEKAREKLIVSTYWEQSSVDLNKLNGINMLYGIKDIYAFHIFHEIPGGRIADVKNIEGYRF
jgi:hypothetical protein